MSKATSPGDSRRRVVIIGGGVGGLICAIRLKSKLGFDNFTIYEKAADTGGTWRDNTYPGCGSDVPVHFYSLSTNLNADWKGSYGSQAEIQAYWKDLAKKYDVLPHVIFNTNVVSAEWDTTEQMYHITIQDLPSGTVSVTNAEVVVSAIGTLETPRYPPGLESISDFKGETFHSARWNHDLDLHGKRVAVIGSGCSATQFIPVITQESTVEVTQFCRTPSWFMSRPRTPYSDIEKWVFANVPGIMRLRRNSVFWQSELSYLAFGHRIINRIVSATLKSYLTKMCPEEYLEQMMPKHPPGCKRLMIDNNYLSALSRPNLTPIFDRITKFTENGILTSKGENMTFDVIIFATGFSADQFSLPVRGVNGITIQGYYDQQNGPTAYRGTTIPGFPNFFVLAGPNTTTGHGSFFFMEEVQIDYALQLIEPVINQTASSFEVTPEATDKYNELIQSRLSHSIYMQCVSWYRAGGDGKVTSIFPGPLTLFWWWLRSPIWKDYKAVGAEKWAKQRRWAKLRKFVGLISCAVLWIWLLSKRYSGPVLAFARTVISRYLATSTP